MGDLDHELLRKHHCKGCSVQFAPYRSYGEWFDLGPIQKTLLDRHVDILIVDAPPDTLGAFARRPALDFFWPYLRTDSLVFLHDTNLDEEGQIAQEWSKKFRRTESCTTEKV